VAVAVATPEVNHLAAVAVHGDGGPDLITAAQIAMKRVGDLPIALIDVTVDDIGREKQLLSHSGSD
jgi:hypothetical protein